MNYLRWGICASLLLCGCVSRQRDHFYVLDAQPAAAAASRSQFTSQITLQVTVPSLTDRGEMVLTGPDGATVLDHERWAAPLADLVTSTLAQDIERRRNDVIVLPRSADHIGIPLLKMRVDIDRIAARLGDHVSIETHWRVNKSGQETVGRDTFTSPQQAQTYADVAAALSACLTLLAERLATEIPAG